MERESEPKSKWLMSARKRRRGSRKMNHPKTFTKDQLRENERSVGLASKQEKRRRALLKDIKKQKARGVRTLTSNKGKPDGDSGTKQKSE
eukprot:9632-Pleurochrysis_carterae.AAC.1